MGMYTQLFLDISLKKDIQKNVIDTLKYMVYGNDEIDDNFWKEPYSRLNWCFNSSSYYFNNSSFSEFRFDSIGGNYRLVVLCDFKNYNNEIDTFLEWVFPYIDDDGNMLGYWRYEEEKEPVIIYGDYFKKVKEKTNG
jgi:hypothetical protein